MSEQRKFEEGAWYPVQTNQKCDIKPMKYIDVRGFLVEKNLTHYPAMLCSWIGRKIELEQPPEPKPVNPEPGWWVAKHINSGRIEFCNVDDLGQVWVVGYTQSVSLKSWNLICKAPDPETLASKPVELDQTEPQWLDWPTHEGLWVRHSHWGESNVFIYVCEVSTDCYTYDNGRQNKRLNQTRHSYFPLPPIKRSQVGRVKRQAENPYATLIQETKGIAEQLRRDQEGGEA